MPHVSIAPSWTSPFETVLKPQYPTLIISCLAIATSQRAAAGQRAVKTHLPAYTPRFSFSSSAINSIARTFGAPETVPYLELERPNKLDDVSKVSGLDLPRER